MSKWKALGLGLLFLTIAITVWNTGGGNATWLPALLTTWFLSLGGYKFWRDWSIVNDAKKELAAAAQQPQALPPMTSPDSKRLFVPPPHK